MPQSGVSRKKPPAFMADFEKIQRVLACLREEIPSEDISKNPVVQHPHNTARAIPERLPAAKIKELSQLLPARAVFAIAFQWVVIAGAMALCPDLAW